MSLDLRQFAFGIEKLDKGSHVDKFVFPFLPNVCLRCYQMCVCDVANCVFAMLPNARLPFCQKCAFAMLPNVWICDVATCAIFLNMFHRNKKTVNEHFGNFLLSKFN